MASQTLGIQQLLIAEKRAAEKVSEARKRKLKRLRQAKEEAQNEIDNFQRERDAQFKEYEKNFLGSQIGDSENIEKETILKIENTIQVVGSKKNAIVEDILSIIYDINPEVQRNYLLKIKNNSVFS